MWNLEGGMIAGIAMVLDDERKYCFLILVRGNLSVHFNALVHIW